MKTERIVDWVIRIADLLLRLGESKRKSAPPPSTLTLRDLLEIKKESDAHARRSQAPTVVIPPPSERRERGGRGPRY